jgi:hypothetical protein
MTAPALLVWWLRPVRIATRVGEQSAVVWNRLCQARVPEPVERRHRDAAAEGRVPESDVVDQEDDHVGSAGGRFTSKRGGALASRASSTVECG